MATFNTLIWLFMQLLHVGFDQMLKSPDKSLPTDWREPSRRVREGPFLIIADKILEAFEDQVIPHSELAKIVCEGNLEQKCTGFNARDSIWTGSLMACGAPS